MHRWGNAALKAFVTHLTAGEVYYQDVRVARRLEGNGLS